MFRSPIRPPTSPIIVKRQRIFNMLKEELVKDLEDDIDFNGRMTKITDEVLYEIAAEGGFIDSLLDLPCDDIDKNIAYIEETLACYYRTVSRGSIR